MKKLFVQWKFVFIIGFLIVLVATLLRVVNLNALPVFADEAIYLRWSQVMRAVPTLRFMPLSDGKQPLFMWIVIPFMKIIDDPLVAGRLVSSLSGISTVVAVFVLSYILFKSKHVALIAAFIYALSPFSVFFERMALVDSMLSMFGVWLLVFLIISIRQLRLDTAMIAGFLLGGAVLTKSTATLFALLIPTTLLSVKIPKKNRFLYILKILGIWGVVVIIGLAMYNILRLGPNYDQLVTRTKDYVYPVSHIFTSPLDPLMPFLDRSLEYYIMLGPSLIIVFAILALLTNFRSHLKEILLLSIWVMFPIFVVSEFSKTLTARYIFFTLPYVCILAASLFLIKKKSYYKYVRNALYFGLAVFALMSLKMNYYLLTDPAKVNLPRSERSGYLEEWTAGTGIKEASLFIRNQYNANPERKIVVGTEGYFGTLPDGLQVYLNDMPQITTIGVGIDFAEVPSQLKESFLAGNKTYLVVNSSRLKADPNDVGLSLVASWKKADRPVGTKEYVQHGQSDYLYLFEVSKVVN